jgi:hypothetical protein
MTIPQHLPTNHNTGGARQSVRPADGRAAAMHCYPAKPAMAPRAGPFATGYVSAKKFDRIVNRLPWWLGARLTMGTTVRQGKAAARGTDRRQMMSDAPEETASVG